MARSDARRLDVLRPFFAAATTCLPKPRRSCLLAVASKRVAHCGQVRDTRQLGCSHLRDLAEGSQTTERSRRCEQSSCRVSRTGPQSATRLLATASSPDRRGTCKRVVVGAKNGRSTSRPRASFLAKIFAVSPPSQPVGDIKSHGARRSAIVGATFASFSRHWTRQARTHYKLFVDATIKLRHTRSHVQKELCYLDMVVHKGQHNRIFGREVRPADHHALVSWAKPSAIATCSGRRSSRSSSRRAYLFG